MDKRSIMKKLLEEIYEKENSSSSISLMEQMINLLTNAIKIGYDEGESEGRRKYIESLVSKKLENKYSIDEIQEHLCMEWNEVMDIVMKLECDIW